MAIVCTIKQEAKEAAATRMSGGDALLQGKYVVFTDGTLKFVANDTVVLADNDTAPPTIGATGTGTAPATVGAYVTGAYIIGNVGAFTVDSQDEAEELAAGADAAFQDYVIMTVVLNTSGSDSRVAVTAGDDVKGVLGISF